MTEIALASAISLACLALAGAIWQFRVLPRRMYREFLISSREHTLEAAKSESMTAEFSLVLRDLLAVPPATRKELEDRAGAPQAATVILLALGGWSVATLIALGVSLISH